MISVGENGPSQRNQYVRVLERLEDIVKENKRLKEDAKRVRSEIDRDTRHLKIQEANARRDVELLEHALRAERKKNNTYGTSELRTKWALKREENEAKRVLDELNEYRERTRLEWMAKEETMKRERDAWTARLDTPCTACERLREWETQFVRKHNEIVRRATDLAASERVEAESRLEIARQVEEENRREHVRVVEGAERTNESLRARLEETRTERRLADAKHEEMIESLVRERDQLRVELNEAMRRTTLKSVDNTPGRRESQSAGSIRTKPSLPRLNRSGASSATRTLPSQSQTRYRHWKSSASHIRRMSRRRK